MTRGSILSIIVLVGNLLFTVYGFIMIDNLSEYKTVGLLMVASYIVSVVTVFIGGVFLYMEFVRNSKVWRCLIKWLNKKV